MKKLLTDEMDNFLRKNADGIRTKEITEILNSKFGTSFSCEQIKQYKNRHGIKNGLQHVGISKEKLFSDEIKKFIESNVVGTGTKELAELVNNEFGTSYTYEQMKSYKARYKLKSGIDSTFKKGNVPFNKGLKGYCAEGCQKGWFKKGMKPMKHRPVGSERVKSKDGYTLVKVAEPRTWKLKHRVIWENHNGQVPKGYVVIFLDGDKTNFDINNLACVSRNELKILNKNGLIYDNAEATKTGIAIAKVIATKQKRKKKK